MNDEHSRGAEPHLTMQNHPLPKGEPWKVYVDVYLKRVTPRLEFEIASCLPTEPRPVNGKQEDYLVFDNKGRKGFDIYFQLHDLTGRGYKFPDVESDAVWSKKGNVCPDRSWGRNEVFDDLDVSGSGDTLKVYFRNKADSSGNKPGDFRYTLNVTTTGGEPYLALDPGGTGSNGPSSLS